MSERKTYETWRLEEILPCVFNLQFDNEYDLGMHFLRYQEYYESPKFKGKRFSLLEYMEWYAKTQCEWDEDKGKRRTGKSAVRMFSYPADWSRYNIPCYVLDEVHDMGIFDMNAYDTFMQGLHDFIRVIGYMKYYLIGTKIGAKEDTIKHELSHAMFYVDEEYENAARKLYHETDKKVTAKFGKTLLKYGYCKDVMIDETVAYFATGLPDDVKPNENTARAMIRFKKLFEEAIKKQRGPNEEAGSKSRKQIIQDCNERES